MELTELQQQELNEAARRQPKMHYASKAQHLRE